VATLVTTLAALLLVSCSGAHSPSSDGASGTAPGAASASAPESPASPAPKPPHPDIVFVLTDDLSWNLVKHMPHVRQLMKKGTTFSNYFVTDSLCCPSRTSIFTGEYPHDDGVYTNNGNDGGYDAFMRHGDDKKCYARAMQRAGYRTGFMGKYLNGYHPEGTNGGSKPYVPAGWNEWDAAGSGYYEYNYNLNSNGRIVPHGHAPQDYLTDVISSRASSFIDASARAGKPFMLETATFAPHSPSIPAPRDAHRFSDLKAPRTPAYDVPSTPEPAWQKRLPPLPDGEQRQIDRDYVKRVRSVQAVDRMIGSLEDKLKAEGLADDTYFVFNSDNGFHMGEHRLWPGKSTAYDTDIKVPLIVTGPGVPAGHTVSQQADNIDLSPTFQELAGLTPASNIDGRSLAGLIHGRPAPSDWRRAVLVEHHHPAGKKNDPDAGPEQAGDPPSYEAMRTAGALYVEYADGEREYYDTATDPNELRNLAPSLTPDRRTALHTALAKLEHCHGTSSCKAAALTTG
jgi:arylsulfatase A-like enzyme